MKRVYNGFYFLSSLRMADYRSLIAPFSLAFRSFLLFSLAFFSFPLFLHASFEDIGVGARPTSLGNAFTALSDDIYALYYNPAGLVHLERKELSMTYGLFHTGLSDGSEIRNSYLAYGHPLETKLGNLGFSWHQFFLLDLYNERTITLGYGREISEKWSAGLNLKHLYRQLSAPTGGTTNTGSFNSTQSDSLFVDGNSKNNIGIDLGLLFKFDDRFTYGFALQNLNEPNLSISDKRIDSLPMTMRSGVAYRHEDQFVVLGELETRRSAGGSKRDVFLSVAGEKWWPGEKLFAGREWLYAEKKWLRSGLGQANFAARGSLSYGSSGFSQIGVGLSYQFNFLQVDYGFLVALGGISLGDSQGNHRFSLTLKFGEILADSDQKIRLHKAKIEIQKAEKELEEIKKERDKTLQNLEKIKLEPEKQKKENRAVSQEMKRETIRQEQERNDQKGEKKSATTQTMNQFEELSNQYWVRKSAGALPKERIEILTRILEKFSDFDLDLSVMKSELAAAKSDLAKSEMDLSLSWSYYQKLSDRGASLSERIQLLNQMIKRFADTGVDLSNLHAELKSLRRR